MLCQIVVQKSRFQNVSWAIGSQVDSTKCTHKQPPRHMMLLLESLAEVAFDHISVL